MQCGHCGMMFEPSKYQRANAKKGRRVYCSKACAIDGRRKKVPIFKDCAQCGVNFELNHTQNWKAVTGRASEFFCGRACSTKWRHENSEALRASLSSESKRQKAREALARHNWLQTPESVEKNRQTRLARGSNKGIRISNRGGNGAGLTVPQEMLASALQWQTEFVVRTGAEKGSGKPYHYKIDIANPALKIAIEVDGRSHRWTKTKESDARKDAFLTSLGWRVLRFSNQAVMDDLEGCVLTVTSMTSPSKGITTSSPKES